MWDKNGPQLPHCNVLYHIQRISHRHKLPSFNKGEYCCWSFPFLSQISRPQFDITLEQFLTLSHYCITVAIWPYFSQRLMKWHFLFRSGLTKRKRKKQSWLAELFSADTLKVSKRSLQLSVPAWTILTCFDSLLFLLIISPKRTGNVFLQRKQTLLNFQQSITSGLTLMSMCLRNKFNGMNHLSIRTVIQLWIKTRLVAIFTSLPMWNIGHTCAVQKCNSLKIFLELWCFLINSLSSVNK